MVITPSTIAKTLTQAIVTSGTSMLLGSTLKALTPADATLYQKFAIKTASVGIIGFLSLGATKFYSQRIDVFLSIFESKEKDLVEAKDGQCHTLTDEQLVSIKEDIKEDQQRILNAIEKGASISAETIERHIKNMNTLFPEGWGSEEKEEDNGR